MADRIWGQCRGHAAWRNGRHLGSKMLKMLPEGKEDGIKSTIEASIEET